MVDNGVKWWYNYKYKIVKKEVIKLATHSVVISQATWEILNQTKQETGIPITKIIDMLVNNSTITVVKQEKK